MTKLGSHGGANTETSAAPGGGAPLAESSMAERPFRALVEHVPAFLWSADGDGVPDYYNPPYLEYLGRTLDEMGPTTWVETLHPDDRESAQRAWERAHRTGTAYSIEFRIRGASDGAYRWFLSRAQPLRSADGAIVRWFGTVVDVHDRVEAERAARAAEHRFRAVLESSIDCIYRLDLRSGRYEYVSPSIEKLFGYSAAEMMAMSPEEGLAIVHPEDRSLLVEAVQRPGEVEVEYRVRIRSGELRWFAARFSSEHDDQGRPAFRNGTIRDIQDRKLRDAALRDAHERLSAALEASTIAVFAQDLDLRSTWVHNHRLGLRPEEYLGKTDYEIFERAEDAERVIALKRRVLETGEPARAEVCVQSRGRAFCYDMTVHPRYDDGRLCGVIGTAVEITDRKRADQALLVTSQRLEAAQRVAGIGIFDWDLRSGAIYWSPEVYRLMGLEPGAVSASTEAWERALVDEDREGAWSQFRDRAAAHAERYEVERRLRLPQGGTRWVRISSLLRYDEDGEPTQIVGAIVDIEALKRAANAHEVARRELERASQAKDDFLATMSHELRTPLHAMLGWATILRKKPRDEQRLERGLEAIERNARAQERLVSDLLDVSRIVSGKLQLNVRRTDIAAVLFAAADVVRPAAEAKGVRLIVDLDPGVGEIVADADRLQQIVWNLLSNAVRFTPRGGRVTVTSDRTPAAIRIGVQDTGAGIPPEHLPHVFERFLQVDSSTTRAHGGLGLGLAIVRHLVEAHGGDVRAESEGAGRGATFTVELPIHAVDTSLASARAESPGAGVRTAGSSAAGVSLRGVRVLVVDDDPDALDLLGTVLGEAGAAVTSARGAREALDASGPFDVIVSDIGMPGVDGYSFMRRVRSRDVGADVPAIALTAYAREEDAERALRSGFQVHLRKPVDPGELVAAVASWAALHRSAG